MPEEPEDEPSYSLAPGRAFTPGGALALALKVLLGINVFLGIVALGSDYLQCTLVTRLVRGEDVPHAQFDSNDSRQMLLGVVHTLLYLVTAIVFLFWFYRVHANLKPLGGRDVTYTSGWAVGSWFVPFLNLVRPVQVAQEIWRNSDPASAAYEGVSKERSTNSALIGFWWAIWLIANIINNIALRMLLDARSPESLRTATGANMVAEVASVFAALLALAVVWAIDARQTARAEAVWPERDIDLS